MLQLTRKTDYGIRLMLEVGAHGNGGMSTAEVARRQEIPYQFLRKVAQTLVAQGLLASRRGSTPAATWRSSRRGLRRPRGLRVVARWLAGRSVSGMRAVASGRRRAQMRQLTLSSATVQSCRTRVWGNAPHEIR